MAVYSSVDGLIKNIVQVVQRMYFSYVDLDIRQELLQEGYLICYELLAKGDYNPDKNLRNYLFTGVRNAMTNYMYKYNKTKTNLSTEEIDSSRWQQYENVGDDSYFLGKIYSIPENDIALNFTEDDLEDAIEKYKNFGDDYLTALKPKLIKLLALEVSDKTDDCTKLNNTTLIDNAVMGELIWKKIINNRRKLIVI
jgi:DNA-directed RNA polymerase specialized sigma24 family protein